MAFSVSYIYEIINKYSGPLSKVTRDTDKFKRSVTSLNSKIAVMQSRLQKSGLNKFGRSLKDTGNQLTTRMSLPLLALGAIAGKTAIEMQSGFIGVQKTVVASAGQLARMRTEFEKMSTQIPVSVNKLYEIGEAAGQLGIETKNITSFTKTMAMLGATTNIAGEEGARQLAQFANITKMSQGNFDRLGSTIVHLGNNLATTEADIADMALRLASSGRIVGMSEHQILALAAAAKSVGLNSEAGGTAFSRVMLKMDDAVSTGGKKFRMFAKISGMATEEFAKKFKTDAAGSIVAFTKGLGKLKEQGANVSKTLKALGMADIRVRDALLRAAGAGDIFTKALAMGAVAWKQNNALTKEADLRFGSWSSKLKIVWNRIKLVANSLGKILVPAFIKLADFVVLILEKFNGLSKTSKIVVAVLMAIAIVIPPLIALFGLLLTAIAAIQIAFASGVFAGIIGVLGSITLAAAGPYLAFAALAAIFAGMVYKSASLRQAFSNLGDALSPLLEAIKTIALFLGEKLGVEFDRAGNQLEAWGDIFSGVINGIAAMIKGLFNLIEGLAKATAALVEGEGIGAAWSALKGTLGYSKETPIVSALEKVAALAPAAAGSALQGALSTVGIGQGVAEEKRSARVAASESNKMEISGQIGVTGRDGSTVTDSTINLNQGYNLVAAH